MRTGHKCETYVQSIRCSDSIISQLQKIRGDNDSIKQIGAVFAKLRPLNNLGGNGEIIGAHQQKKTYNLNCTSLVAQRLKCLPAMQETWVDPWVGKISWRRERLPTPVFLGFPGGSVGKESTCNVGDLGRSLGWEDPLGKGIATHSSILAWRIPWTLQSMGSQRVGHD